VLCPACGGGSTKLAFAVDTYQHVRCLACGTLRVEPPPDEAELSAIYSIDGYDVARKLELRLRAEARVRSQQLVRLGARSVLDVGCAAGFFLDAARESGLDVVGVEPGPSGADAVARGHRVHQTWLQTVDLGGRKFDAVSLWEVVEHVSDPLALLQEAQRHLAPGGVIAFSTPSMSGLPALLMGRHFPMVNPPQHLTLLSRAGLLRLLERAGLRIRSLESFSNLHQAQVLARMERLPFGGSALAPPLARLCVAGARLMDRAGLGSEFEVFAVRNGS
jgi:SAM-dependent methyltransferase